MRRSAATEVSHGCGGSGDHFRGGWVMTERRGHVFYRHEDTTLLTTSTWQVSGYSFLTSAPAANMARRSSEQRWQLLFDLLDFEEASSIIPNHPRCAAHVPVHPAIPLPSPPTSLCLLLPVCRPTRLEYAHQCDRSTSRRHGSRPGLAALPSWLRRPLPRFAGASGVRRACTFGSDGVLST